MAYQLQPGLSIVQNAGAIAPVKATDEVFVYPQPSSTNCGGCHQTLCCTVRRHTWLGRVPQPASLTQVINSDPRQHHDLIELSCQPMNANCSH